MSEDATPALPDTKEGWCTCLAALSPRALFTLLQTDKAFPKSLFTGFRPSIGALQHPIVVERLTKLLLTQPVLARAVYSLPKAEPKPTPEPASLTPLSPTPSSPVEDTKLKEKVKALRAQVRESQSLCERQEALLEQARAERDAALLAAATSQKAYQELVGRTEHERRQRERETKSPSPKAPKESPSPTRASTPSPVGPVIGPLEDALSRLLRRGKHTMVAGLCRELLLEEGLEAQLRATVHGLYATSLIGLAREPEASEQERLAAEAYLDTGLLPRASEAFSRCLIYRTDGALRLPEKETLLRLLAMTARAGATESALLSLRRLRIMSPGGFRVVVEATKQSGKKHAAALSFLTEAPGHRSLGPREPVALPISARATATVTAEGLVRAVAACDEDQVFSAKRGLVALHESNPALADALLESIAELSPHAVFPFVRARLRPIVVDASNVARYVSDPLAQLVQKKHQSQLAPLLTLREHLLQRGFFPILMIADASLRHHIDEKARYLQLVEQHTIRETPAGTEADEALLSEARARKAPLVTRDRFKDWGEAARDVERLTFEIYAGGVALTAD